MLKKSVTLEEIQRKLKENSEITYYSRFGHLQVMNGIRPSMIHGLLGTSGSGKSSILKTHIVDAARNNKVLIHLSEETILEFQVAMHKIPDAISSMKNMMFLEEKNLDAWVTSCQDDFLGYFRELVIESGAKLVFIDNITSSLFYTDDVGPEGQSKTAHFFSKMSKDLDLAIFYVAHTSKRVVDNQSELITIEDIRGSAKMSIISENMFVLQKFTSGNKVYSILRVAKHRHHEVQNPFYLLKFEDGAYTGDLQIEFSLVNKIFRMRNKLGG